LLELGWVLFSYYSSQIVFITSLNLKVKVCDFFGNTMQSFGFDQFLTKM
jgi:hypothetical protein